VERGVRFLRRRRLLGADAEALAGEVYADLLLRERAPPTQALYRTALHRRWIDGLRRRRRRHHRELAAARPEALPPSFSRAEELEQSATVRGVIAGLAESGDREALRALGIHFLEGQTVQETARVLRCRERTVRRRIARGRRLLQGGLRGRVDAQGTARAACAEALRCSLVAL
jgi:DNA-directed RNA polymerase specialized sigma24 family protein